MSLAPTSYRKPDIAGGGQVSTQGRFRLVGRYLIGCLDVRPSPVALGFLDGPRATFVRPELLARVDVGLALCGSPAEPRRAVASERPAAAKRE